LYLEKRNCYYADFLIYNQKYNITRNRQSFNLDYIIIPLALHSILYISNIPVTSCSFHSYTFQLKNLVNYFYNSVDLNIHNHIYMYMHTICINTYTWIQTTFHGDIGECCTTVLLCHYTAVPLQHHIIF